METQDIKKAGLKVTLPRIKILEILERDGNHHLTAEAIFQTLREEDSDIGLATVYRVLTQFENAGLVTRHHFEGGQAVFELDRGDHHDHLVCVRCGNVVEFYDEVIEARQQEIARREGFTIQDHSLILYGICADCAD